MATFSKQILSGSTNGTGITVANTATVGTTIHATGTSASVIDEIWLYAVNIHSSAVTLTIEYGGVSTTKDLIQQSIAATPSGLVLVCAGLILRGTGSAATTVSAFANSASKIEIFGFVNRIAQVLLVSRYSFRTQVQQPTLANWGKAAPAGLGVVEGYGVATGGTSSSITASSKAYTLLSFTSDGTLTVATAGLFDCLVVGGGGGGGYSATPIGGGGGGGVMRQTIYIPAGTYAVKIGAGGSAGSNGQGSAITDVLYASGGGGSGGHGSLGGGQKGANGGGSGGFIGSGFGSTYEGVTGSLYAGVGYSGGNKSGDAGSNGTGGAGGGAAGNASGGTGGAGRDQSDFLGNAATTNYFGAGGGGSNGTDGTGNASGNSGGGAHGNGSHGARSGAVYVRFRI